MNKLLLLEDDLSLIDGLSYSLKKQGGELDTARTVREAKVEMVSNGIKVLLLRSCFDGV